MLGAHYQDHAPSFIKEVPAQICQECPGQVHGLLCSYPCDCRGSVQVILQQFVEEKWVSGVVCVKPAPGRQQTRPNAELDSQQGQRETRASVLTHREERWKANGMNNSEASLRIRAYAHS
jgi:hypothetical protein